MLDLKHKFEYWKPTLKDPDWYVQILPELKEILKFVSEQSAENKLKLKNEVYNFFEREIEAGYVALGQTGYDFDAERKPIDTVVIHHTENLPGITW